MSKMNRRSAVLILALALAPAACGRSRDDRSRNDLYPNETPQMRRQIEKLKMENDQMQAEHEQNMAEALEQHRAVEAELNIRISGLQAALEDTTEVNMPSQFLLSVYRQVQKRF